MAFRLNTFVLFLLWVGVSGFAMSCDGQRTQYDAELDSSGQAGVRQAASAAQRRLPRFELRYDCDNPTTGELVLLGLPEPMLAELDSLQLLDSTWRRLFPVYVADEMPIAEDQPAMLGVYTVTRDFIRFEPRFVFEPGMSYVARFHFDLAKTLGVSRLLGCEDDLVKTFQIPRVKAGPTFVTAVYPSGNVLPENTVRLYVHFSAPVSHVDLHEHIKLTEVSGNPVDLAFIETSDSLWDSESERLTLFFHPGRTKGEVSPNKIIGSVLQAGKKYRLTIESTLPDASGVPLAQAYEREFEVIPADRTSPALSEWEIAQLPFVGTKEPLVIHFPGPLDFALLHRMLMVVDDTGQQIFGSILVSEFETRWAMTPRRPWAPGQYQLLANPALEDLAGNRLDRIFDQVEQRQTGQIEPTHPFVIDFKPNAVLSRRE